MNAFTLRFIGSQLSKKGWRVEYYNYSSMFTSFEQNVDGLHAFWLTHSSADTHLVGHSLGGLLVLAMMEKYKLRALPRTVLMGSPVQGSAVAKKMSLSRWGRFLLGESMTALIAGRRNTQNNKIGVIAGNRGIGIGHLIQTLPEPHDGVVAVEEAKLDAEDQVGPPLTVLPVTHASMLLSKKVVSAIDRYLSVGRFGS